MKSSEIRKKFIDYFVKNGHTFVPSAPSVPADDPTLLFTNSGMNQFKNTFLGFEKRDYSRATNSQKCVRAGGKHNDLEAVGHTARHHTFFEMLGNFSFADYFKKEAIHYAWDLLINEMGFDKDRLYISVFETDDEAADIWHKQEGVPKDRIFRFGEKDNFWRMADTGPCGPSSEIFYDHGALPGEEPDPYKNILNGGDRFVEIWNLVFMQHNESAPGQMTDLKNPSIDTGGGLERWAAALQGRPNNYDTDLFEPIIQNTARLAGLSFSADPKERNMPLDQLTALRVLADHARTAAVLIADGVLPSNEGRGYVLRRILRRGIRYGRNLSDNSLLPVAVETVIDEVGDFFGELKDRKSVILKNVKDEESRFLTTLDTGTELLTDSLKKLENQGVKTLSGETVFKLYDTYGFPADLTRVMAEERGFQIDEKGFATSMEQAKQKARASWKGGQSAELKNQLAAICAKMEKTQFCGYQSLAQESELTGIVVDGKLVDSASQGAEALLFFKATPFYAEGGGQVGDSGRIVDGTATVATVKDCQKFDDVFVHFTTLEANVNKGQQLTLQVENSDRREIANHHSATHLLHSALRNRLGEHVTQAGSLVDVDRLRFDFSHNQPLSKEEIQDIEDQVNQKITEGLEVGSQLMTKDQATEAGALALFGEKYGAEVRVIQMGDYSIELCGGTHVANTAHIRTFKVVSETGVSSGVRRIEALCGQAAMNYLNKHLSEHTKALHAAGTQQNWVQFLNDDKEKLDLAQWVQDRKDEIRDLKKEIQQAKSSSVDLNEVINNASTIATDAGEVKFVSLQLPVDDRKVLSEVADKLRDKLPSGVAVISGQGDGSHPILVTVSKSLNPKVNAGKILKAVAGVLGGKGGGRPDFAQGAAPDLGKWQEAVDMVSEKLVSLNF